jgi:succinate-semialdehyde dehydrogenase / glutarate-semialdehyde dehydrogenase
LGRAEGYDDLLIERALIGGEWIAADQGGVIEVTDPATGLAIGNVPDCSEAETERAIEAAARAMVDWRRRPAADRATIMMAWHAAILDRANDLARLITLEQGKPLAEADGEIRYAASFIAWFAAEAVRVRGHDVPSPDPARRIIVLKEPVGVCAAITPWNFPAAMITRKLGPALAAGCAMVVKPSELTPFTALALARLGIDAGLPPGLVSIVTGRPEPIGRVLTGHPLVRKLSFTGSTAVGRRLMADCAPGIKRLSLELGGNAPFIVFDDADLDLAVEGVMFAKFRNGGQTCVCANRILVQSGIHDRFVKALAEQVRKLSVGPLISPAAAEKFQSHVDDALAHGARLVATGAAAPDQGAFVTPVLLDNVTSDMCVAHEETFGPLAAVFRFETEDEAIALANATPFGLAAYFYTRDSSRSWRVAAALEAGMVGLNTGSVSMEAAPFGGIKQSGLGREGGQEGIEEYLETKAFHWSGLG